MQKPVRRSQLALLLSLWACSAPQPPEGPPGAWWVGERPAVEALLVQLGALEGTPLGTWAGRLDRALPEGCARLGSHAPDGDLAALSQTARCVAEGDALDDALSRAQREDHGTQLAFGHVDSEVGSLRGALRVDAAEVALGIDWRDLQAEGALALLLPGDAGAGPDRLARDGRLLHARVRPAEGVDLSALAPQDSQADRLFALRSALFESAVLDGTWELALYAPETPGSLPAAALALGVRSPRAAAAAAEAFLAELGATWSVSGSPLSLPAGTGSCLLELAVLPELAPCYVSTETALVVAWNSRALGRALRSGPGAADAEADPQAAGRLELDLERVGRSDARAARRLAELQGVDAPVIDWPWRRLSASARRRGDALRVDARLLTGGGSS